VETRAQICAVDARLALPHREGISVVGVIHWKGSSSEYTGTHGTLAAVPPTNSRRRLDAKKERTNFWLLL